MPPKAWRRDGLTEGTLLVDDDKMQHGREDHMERQDWEYDYNLGGLRKAPKPPKIAKPIPRKHAPHPDDVFVPQLFAPGKSVELSKGRAISNESCATILPNVWGEERVEHAKLQPSSRGSKRSSASLGAPNWKLKLQEQAAAKAAKLTKTIPKNPLSQTREGGRVRTGRPGTASTSLGNLEEGMAKNDLGVKGMALTSKIGETILGYDNALLWDGLHAFTMDEAQVSLLCSIQHVKERGSLFLFLSCAHPEEGWSLYWRWDQSVHVPLLRNNSPDEAKLERLLGFLQVVDGEKWGAVGRALVPIPASAAPDGLIQQPTIPKAGKRTGRGAGTFKGRTKALKKDWTTRLLAPPVRELLACRGLNKPPQLVEVVFAATMTLVVSLQEPNYLKIKVKSNGAPLDTSWSGSINTLGGDAGGAKKQMLSEVNECHRVLCNFKGLIDDGLVPKANFKHARRYLKRVDFNPEAVARVSGDASSLCAWVCSAVEYYDSVVEQGSVVESAVADKVGEGEDDGGNLFSVEIFPSGGGDQSSVPGAAAASADAATDAKLLVPDHVVTAQEMKAAKKETGVLRNSFKVVKGLFKGGGKKQTPKKSEKEAEKKAKEDAEEAAVKKVAAKKAKQDRLEKEADARLAEQDKAKKVKNEADAKAEKEEVEAEAKAKEVAAAKAKRKADAKAKKEAEAKLKKDAEEDAAAKAKQEEEENKKREAEKKAKAKKAAEVCRASTLTTRLLCATSAFQWLLVLLLCIYHPRTPMFKHYTPRLGQREEGSGGQGEEGCRREGQERGRG
jgi:hypothetical protein